MKFHADVYAWFPDGRVKLISPGDGIYYQACVHPSGSHAVFFGAPSGPPRVWKADLATGQLLPLTPDRYGARHATFSWDGKHIVFASDRASGQPPERIEDMSGWGGPPSGLTVNLFVMDVDGGNIRQITSGAHVDERPSFSPDGRTVAFVSDRGGPQRIWSVPADGRGEPHPVQRSGRGYRPWYSADGQWIFFFAPVYGSDHICRIAAAGGDMVPLPNDVPGNSHGPFADPGGETLLIHSIRRDVVGVWELPLDGGPAWPLQPPGFVRAAHATRASNGVIVFDARRPGPTVP